MDHMAISPRLQGYDNHRSSRTLRSFAQDQLSLQGYDNLRGVMSSDIRSQPSMQGYENRIDQ